MNIISMLLEKNEYPRLSHYEKNSSMRIASGRLIARYEEAIKQYYSRKPLIEVDDINSYIDYIFLIHISNLDHLIDNTEFKTGCSLDQVIKDVKIGSIINFLNTKHKDVFAYNEQYSKYGLWKLTIVVISKYPKQVKDETIKFIIKNQPVLIFDGIHLVKKLFNSRKHLYHDMFVNPHSLLELYGYRLEHMIKFLSDNKGNLKDLIPDIEEKLISIIKGKYNNGHDHLIHEINLEANRIKGFLHKNESKKYRDFEKLYNRIDEDAKDYLRENGSLKIIEMNCNEYKKIMDILTANYAPEFHKFLILTHEPYHKEYGFTSYIDTFINNYEYNFLDNVASIKKTNDYFTTLKQERIYQFLLNQSIDTLYWFDEENFDEFIDCMWAVIADINKYFETMYTESQLEVDLMEYKKVLFDSIKEMNPEKKHLTAMKETCAMLETVLRSVYVEIKHNAYFIKEKITLGQLLKIEDNPLVELVGYNTMMWLRYFLVTDNGVGHEIRNKLIHNRDLGTIVTTLPGLTSVLWLFVTTINSISVSIHTVTVALEE